MAQHDRMTVLNAIFDTGLVPVFYHKDVETAIPVIEACAAGGARAVEFTNRGDLAYKVFVKAMEHIIANKIDVILGVGSIVDAPTAALYISSGANFVVAPLFIEIFAVLLEVSVVVRLVAVIAGVVAQR